MIDINAKDASIASAEVYNTMLLQTEEKIQSAIRSAIKEALYETMVKVPAALADDIVNDLNDLDYATVIVDNGTIEKTIKIGW